MKGIGILGDKTLNFAIRIVNLKKFLEEKNEFIISKQILRSGTAIGANCKEAQYAQSKMDFLSKINIALKEASETDYWLTLLYKTDFIQNNLFNSLHNDCDELIKILASTVKTTKSNTSKK